MTEARRGFGLAVRLARTRKGWSQEGLARAAELERTYVSDIERGVRNPSLEVQVRIAAALEVPLSELWAEAEREQERARQRHSARRRGSS